MIQCEDFVFLGVSLGSHFEVHFSTCYKWILHISGPENNKTKSKFFASAQEILSLRISVNANRIKPQSTFG